MDEAVLRRRLDAVTPEASDAAMGAARRALEQRIASATATPVRRARGRRSRRLVVGGLGVAAAGTAAIVVATGLGPTQSASAEVSRTLHGAADAVAASTAQTDGCREHLQRRVSGASGRVRHGQMVVDDSSILIEGDVTLRMSDDPGVWERIYSSLRPVAAWGPAKTELLADLAADDKEIVERSDSSRYFWEPGATEVSPRSIAATPRDAGALLRELTGVTDPDSALQKDTERAIDKASDLLGSGLADADLQAAIYRALEQLPGLVIDRHATDVDGRHGVGIGVITSHGTQRIDLIIDPATGRYLGRTEVDLTSVAGAPAGTIEEGTAVYPL